jgi:hypothetical protein
LWRDYAPAARAIALGLCYKIQFIFKKQEMKNPSFSTIFHGRGAPGLGQQNFRMTKDGNIWTQTVSNLMIGMALTYWFTYEKAGLAYDTGQYRYTH